MGFGSENNPTSTKHRNDLEYIRIWVTPHRRLIFWDGAPSPSYISTCDHDKLQYMMTVHMIQMNILHCT